MNNQLFFGDKAEKVIVQVKGGASVRRANIATLKGDLDREKARKEEKTGAQDKLF